MPSRLVLLGESLKTKKGLKRGWISRVLYMSPASEAGVNMCEASTTACRAACLGHNSGQLALDHAKQARLWKTALFSVRRDLFDALLWEELDSLRRVGRKRRCGVAVRLNGSTDVWHGGVMREFPSIQFYDYTKRADLWRWRATAANLHLTWSYRGKGDRMVPRVLSGGGTVAVVFDRKPKRRHHAGEPLPEEWRGWPVLDGDVDDLRFLDPPGHVVGLRFKANRRREPLLKLGRKEGFVQCG